MDVITNKHVGRYLALSGGVGGAKVALGLSKILGGSELAIAVNTADDFDHLGLHVSPDLDTVLYTLAGENNPETGWGRRDETWNFMQSLAAIGGETWFQLGDRDLATNVERTHRLRQGQTLTEVTAGFANAFSVEHSIFPMSDDPVRTMVHTDSGLMEFQNYFVREQCRPKVLSVEYVGANKAQLNPEIVNWVNQPDFAGIILCPSNPFLSIDPMLAIPALRSLLQNSGVPVIAVSPIVGGGAIKGPTAKIMRELSLPLSAAWVAENYADFLNGFVLDQQDSEDQGGIEAFNLQVQVADTVMQSLEDKIRVAQVCIDLLTRLGSNTKRDD